MSDRYILKLKCAYCDTLNDDIYYADDWAETFKCKKCKKENKIEMHFVAVRKTKKGRQYG